MPLIKNYGTSLVEVILATGIMAFAMIPIAGMMGYGIKGNQKDFRAVQAIQLAEARLNQVMAIDFQMIPDGNDITDDISSGSQVVVPLGPETIGQAGYEVHLESSLVDSSFDFYWVDLNPSLPNPPYVATDPATWVFIRDPTAKTLAGSDRRLRRLKITVAWKEPTNQDRKIELLSYKADLSD